VSVPTIEAETNMSREIAHTLSPREAAILTLASEGYTDSAIANHLEISEGTVGTYWGRIRTKLGPYSRPELVAIAIRSELAQQIELLEIQRDTLKAELETSEATEHLYEEVLDAADEGVIVIRHTGEIEHANPAALSLFAYEQSNLVGEKLSVLVPERYRTEHLRHIIEFGQAPGNRRMNDHSQTLGLAKDGREISLHIAISAVHRDGETLFTAFIHPGDLPRA
jgi:PAS domain S-box-containing protein